MPTQLCVYMLQCVIMHAYVHMLMCCSECFCMLMSWMHLRVSACVSVCVSVCTFILYTSLIPPGESCFFLNKELFVNFMLNTPLRETSSHNWENLLLHHIKHLMKVISWLFNYISNQLRTFQHSFLLLSLQLVKLSVCSSVPSSFHPTNVSAFTFSFLWLKCTPAPDCLIRALSPSQPSDLFLIYSTQMPVHPWCTPTTMFQLFLFPNVLSCCRCHPCFASWTSCPISCAHLFDCVGLPTSFQPQLRWFLPAWLCLPWILVRPLPTSLYYTSYT